MPKESFYKNLKLSSAVKDSFVHDVESITAVNSIRPPKVNITDGEYVHEVLVMRIDLKGMEVPVGVIEAIDGANPSKKLFACVRKGDAGAEGCLAVKVGKLAIGPWQPLEFLHLDVRSSSLDILWDSLASQVLYGDTGRENETIEERFSHDQKVAALRSEIAKVDAKARKERQFSRKNELIAKVKALKRQLAEIEERQGR